MANKHRRIFMLETKEVEPSPGATIRYSAGEYYVLPEKVAQYLIFQGAAEDPEAPETMEGEDN